MSSPAIEKLWPAVPPQLLTANGTNLGVVTVANSAGFKVKQQVVISATGLPDQTVKIMRFISPTSFYVGPTNPTAGQGLTARIDISAYTTALGAFVYAQEQPKVTIKPEDIIQAVYRQEPGTTIGVELDDQWGQPYSQDYPVPVGVIGDVDVNINGLNSFQTSQYTVGTVAVQITPTPLTNRSAISLKAVTSGNPIWIGNSSAVTASTGYPLYNDDAINMDLTGDDQIWAICASAGQILCALELA